MPDTVLDAGDTVMNKADQIPALKEHMLLTRVDIKLRK